MLRSEPCLDTLESYIMGNDSLCEYLLYIHMVEDLCAPVAESSARLLSG